ncbi:agglutinin-like protein ARB_02240 [Colletotrichum liriopes]|uniref:Agglutinin-like protein ARB_02240 n=1 Tax=Colletotrichum liriopes TaxID=708192 RepID=A0AA37GCI3_9PEZI|nr:agglutinin-like protein ARB_02240 [Colletotrichum liriopes]
MRLTSLLALGALTLSVTAHDDRVVYARQNESSPEATVQYSAAPESSPPPSSSPKSEVESSLAPSPSSTPASKPAVESASSVVAQPEPTPTDAEKKSPTYDTNTDNCEHWSSKCPWGKTVTITETKKEVVTKTVTEEKTILSTCKPVVEPEPTYAVPTYGSNGRKKRTHPEICETRTTTIWKTLTESFTIPLTVTQGYTKTQKEIETQTQKYTETKEHTQTQKFTETQEVTATRIHTSVSTFLTTHILTTVVPTTVVSSSTIFVTKTYTTIETQTKKYFFTDTVTQKFTETQKFTDTQRFTDTATITNKLTDFATITKPVTKTATVTSVFVSPTTVVSTFVYTTRIPYTITVDHITTTTAWSISTFFSYLTYTTSATVTATAERTATLTEKYTSPTTIFVPTTYYDTITLSSYPVTVTNERTVRETSYITSIRTIVSEIPVVSFITRTRTALLTVVVPTTIPGEVTTIRIPTTIEGEVTTVLVPTTIPGEVTTIQVPTTIEGEATTVLVPTTIPGEVTTIRVPTTIAGELTTILVTTTIEETILVPTTIPGELTTVLVPTTISGEATTILVPTTLPGELTTVLIATTIEETIQVPTTISGQLTTILVPTTATATIQLPPETVTLPGSTIVTTIAGQVTTIQLPGTTLTLRTTDVVTLPPSTTTLPGSTVVTTLTEISPASTVTITEDGITVTSVIPGPTSIVTSTLTLPPITLTIPPSTVTQTEIRDRSACPAPTNTPGVNPVVDFNPKSNRTWGCQPGYVCNPPKPAGCSLWADSPADEYACNLRDCVPAPPYTLATWKDNETHYYPPNDGYFNLDPNAFGLPYDIFDYEVIVTKVKGKKGHKKTTITTGNWASATDLTHFPPTAQPTVTVAPAPVSSPVGKHAYKHHKEGKVYERRSLFNKRDETIVPAVCYDTCNNCYIEVQATGKVSSICNPTSAFQTDLEACRQCVRENAEDEKETLRVYLEPKFQQFITFCEGEAPQKSAKLGSLDHSQSRRRVYGDFGSAHPRHYHYDFCSGTNLTDPDPDANAVPEHEQRRTFGALECQLGGNL